MMRSSPAIRTVGLFAASWMLTAPAACGEENRGEVPRGAARQVVLGPGDVAVAEQNQIQTGPRISGSLEPEREAVVRAETGGSVLSVNAQLGQEVEEGEVLAEIEAEELGDTVSSSRAGLAAAEHALELARRDLARTEHLVEVGALPRRDLDAARSAVVAAEAQLAEARSGLSTAEEQLGESTVRSPIGGIVAERAVNEGDVVSPGAALFTVIDPSSMRLEASVPSEHLSMLSTGTPVRFTVQGYPDQEFVGTIEWIAPAADARTRQIPVVVEIPNEEGRLVARLFAEGRVAADAREALVVPDHAVEREGEQPMATVVRNGKTEHVAIALGREDLAGDGVEVTAGLQPGDVVLLRGAADIPAGTQVVLPGGISPERPASPSVAGGEEEPGGRAAKP